MELTVAITDSSNVDVCMIKLYQHRRSSIWCIEDEDLKQPLRILLQVLSHRYDNFNQRQHITENFSLCSD